MKTKIFVDGSEGTTGLRIHERFQNRQDLEILTISPELRKDEMERKRLINASDITFLCLPDAAAKEAVAMVENENVKIIDTSTAHRTDREWAYGFPELSKEYKTKIQKGKRISVPGCHATGFISLLYPLITKGILPGDYPVSSFSLTGYSGGGKKMIAEYEDANRLAEYNAPREYALNQQHKHLKEMKYITGLSREPLFSPIVADYYSGMLVSVPFYLDMLKGVSSPEFVQELLTEYYKNELFVQVMPFGAEADKHGFLSGNSCSGWDGLKIYVTGNKERIVLSAHFDNLGKGASGAAIQCLNLMLGCKEEEGLVL
ncbi:N-acetyl-gamma-glutamyl-phosphate reductase [Anaerocolumna chitinilytica]|uniref:N-acetyl-gamma-glutamyl-phosphate reductase n=1 Tax=Anaerocolumna chitinilytica TaxID=1727145 RepID=A0A7M3SBB0_9FIRM|nr:N-acetyl-gamma-glutamyl-phosphate reductase [Anaerocolumna chitinilytica]BCK01878.1 N-acetyl-gamma-glutamyl-phosphate reductase [Anaerocolumna chitinilytica]